MGDCVVLKGMRVHRFAGLLICRLSQVHVIVFGSWAQQKMLAGVGWFSRELPLTPVNLLQEESSAQLRTTISKEGKNAARSQKVMEIPAIISETLTTLKP